MYHPKSRLKKPGLRLISYSTCSFHTLFCLASYLNYVTVFLTIFHHARCSTTVLVRFSVFGHNTNQSALVICLKEMLKSYTATTVGHLMLVCNVFQLNCRGSDLHVTDNIIFTL